MEKRGVLILAIFFCLVVVGTVVVYIFYEKPVQEKELEYHDVNIRFYDEETMKQVVTGYIITYSANNVVVSEGTSLKDNFIRSKVLVNNSFIVFNKNLEEQKYYISNDAREDITGIKRTYRIEIPLVKYGTIDIKEDSIFPDDNPYYLIVSTEGAYNHIGYCVRWSSRIISVKSDKYEEIDIPERLLNKVDRCYDMKKSLVNDSVVIDLNYKKFGALKDNDYIEVIVMDGDIDYHNPSEIARGYGEEDLGAPDYKYIVKPNN